MQADTAQSITPNAVRSTNATENEIAVLILRFPRSYVAKVIGSESLPSPN